MHFATMTADELIAANDGRNAAKCGLPLDRTQTEAWQAGWQLFVTENVPAPGWQPKTRDRDVRELELA